MTYLLAGMHTGAMGYGRGEDRIMDGMTQERNDLMVFSSDYYQQKHVYTAGGERIEQFTDRTAQSGGNGGLVRMLYVHEDIVGNTMYYTKDTGSSFCELRYDVWGFPDLSGKLQNNDNGNFAAATFEGHIYDTVIDVYFAEARFYDANNRTFMSTDPVKDGLNWYKYAGNNPTTFFDPTGLFIVAPDGNGGTEMSFGATGNDVMALQDKLRELDMLNFDDNYTYGVFDKATENAVKKYQSSTDEKLPITGVADHKLWRALELRSNQTLEQEFPMHAQKPESPVHVSVKGNTIDIEYFAKFYFSESEPIGYYNGDGEFIEYRAALPFDQEAFDKYAEKIRAGVEEWAGIYTVLGLESQINVSVKVERAESYSESNIIHYNYLGRANMISIPYWSVDNTGKITIYDYHKDSEGNVKQHDTEGKPTYSYTVAHEFGHVLGIGDAYGEWLRKTYPDDDVNMKKNSIMKYHWAEPIILGNDVEMLLTAWSTNSWQSYTGLNPSQAFNR